MSDAVHVKICGLSDPESVAAAVAAGARYVGFVFFPKSPRHVCLAQARALALCVPEGVAKVALTVDADDDMLRRLTDEVPLDMLQLHGHEPPTRVTELRQNFGLPVMKAVGVAGPQDLGDLDTYGKVADQLLVDAKPSEHALLPGGNGLSFDWRLIAGRRWTCPWMLAGGLDAGNVAQAIRLTGARQIDVSSGVEIRPGVKDGARISAFVHAAQSALEPSSSPNIG